MTFPPLPTRKDGGIGGAIPPLVHTLDAPPLASRPFTTTPPPKKKKNNNKGEKGIPLPPPTEQPKGKRPTHLPKGRNQRGSGSTQRQDPFLHGRLQDPTRMEPLETIPCMPKASMQTPSPRIDHTNETKRAHDPRKKKGHQASVRRSIMVGKRNHEIRSIGASVVEFVLSQRRRFEYHLLMNGSPSG